MKKFTENIFDRTFWKFILIGVINTLFGTTIMFVFYNLFHFNYWVSSASNYILVSILSYWLNRKYTFENSEKTTDTIPIFVINISLCYFVAYGVAQPLVTLLLSDLTVKMRDNISMLLGMGLFVLLNYLGQRFFVFHKESSQIHV